MYSNVDIVLQVVSALYQIKFVRKFLANKASAMIKLIECLENGSLLKENVT